MSSLRFASFGAATVPLSKIVVDKDLDMGPYAIKGVYRPEGWATETLNVWDDISPITVYSQILVKTDEQYFTDIVLVNHSGTPRYYNMTVEYDLNTTQGSVKLDGAEIASFKIAHASLGGPTRYDLNNITLRDGETLAVHLTSTNENARVNINVVNTGVEGLPKTANLTGKWLALGVDMKGVEATVNIQGVNVPYADYPKYFPIAPTSLSIPVGARIGQERPVIKVYKGI